MTYNVDNIAEFYAFIDSGTSFTAGDTIDVANSMLYYFDGTSWSDICIIASTALQLVQNAELVEENSLVPSTAIQLVQNAELIEENTIVPSTSLQIKKVGCRKALWHGVE